MDDRARQLAYTIANKKEAATYAAQLGEEALARHLDDARGRCAICWCPDGQPHTSLCPNGDPDEEPPPVTQEDALF